MKPKAQLLVLAGLLATAVILLACLPAQEGVEPATTPGPGTRTPSSAVDAPPTPSLLTPTPAANAGRPDCPQDWAAYQDPDGYFSLCYPADWVARSSLPQAYFGYTFSLLWAAREVSMTSYWSEFGPADRSADSDACSPVSHWENVQQITLMLDGRSVAVCVGDIVDIESVTPQPALFQGSFAEIPLPADGGYVVFFLQQPKDLSEADSTLLSLLVESLRR